MFSFLGGLAIVETVLWDAVPSYLRKLNAQTIESLSKPIPLTLVPIQFSSWMGGTCHFCLFFMSLFLCSFI
jgi:phosphoenolpyruvate carboxylase